MRCISGKASEASYAASDWERASKYTDDSALTAFIDGAFAETLKEVQNSLDQKVQTHYQETDPSVLWTELETVAFPDASGNPILDHTGAEISTIWEKEKYIHEGDLWKKTTDNTEWIYKSGKWMPMEVPDEVFDKIDGKAQVFMTTPYTPYADGDIWITSTVNRKASIKICTTTRKTGSYVTTDWIDPKYVDSDDVKKKIDDYDTALDQLEVYKKLTGGSEEQGIIIKDGRLYMNATYIVAGMLAGKYIDAKGITVKDKNGNIYGTYLYDNTIKYGENEVREGMLDIKDIKKNQTIIIYGLRTEYTQQRGVSAGSYRRTSSQPDDDEDVRM